MRRRARIPGPVAPVSHGRSMWQTRPMAHVLVAGVALLVVTSMPAQAVLQVPAQYAQIDAAIAAAQPGDVVEVATGTYASFTCTKAITITAAVGATVQIECAIQFVTTTVGFVIAAGGFAKVQGLRFLNASYLLVQRVAVTAGCVAFENCYFEGAYNGDCGLRVDGAAVWLRACRCSGHETLGPSSISGNVFPCAGLLATNAIVAAVDCEFAGGGLIATGLTSAGDGLRATASMVHLVRSVVIGGDSASLGCFYPNGHGLHVINGTGTWVVDSTLRGGSGPGCASGGDALRNAGTVPVHLTRVVTLPGVGTSGSGAAVFGPSVADTALGLAGPTVDPRLGSPYRIDYRTNPNESILLFVSDGLVPAAPVVSVEPTWLVGVSPFVALLVADAAGFASFQTTIPNAPSLRFVSLWLHAAVWPSLPLHVAPPIGGVVQ